MYSLEIDNDHIYRSTVGNCPRQAILTFIGGFKSNTISLYLTDIAHHQLGVGIIFVWACHVYLSLKKGYAHRIRDVFFVTGNSGPMIAPIAKSVDLQLSFALGGVYDSIILVALYVHHLFMQALILITCWYFLDKRLYNQSC